MSTWSATSDVQARLAYAATFSGSTNPTSTQVQTLLNDAESEITTALVAAGIASPAASTDAAAVLKRRAVDYAAAQVRLVWASASGGAPADEYAEDLLGRFEAFLDDVGNRPLHWSEVLEAGSPGIDSIMLKGTANADLGGRAVSSVQMAPVFTRGTEI